MPDSRIANTKRNITTGLVRQLLNIVFPFVVQTMILYTLGEQYQGLNGLFTSILTVLNLSELGFSYAVIFILYKPIAEENYDLICSIMSYLRKVYRVIGALVLTLGLVLLPFLRYLINGSCPDDVNIYILYSVYLANSVISYWLFAYKTALITAMQRSDIVNKITIAVKTAMYILQIFVLILFKNYYAFIILLPVFTIINNIMTGYCAKKTFPMVIPKGKIPDITREEIITQVKGIFISKVGDAARNGADNIFISALIGLTAVAIYNNYYYIYAAIYGISLIIVNSMGASVGNSIVAESVQKNYIDLCRFTFMFSWFTGWCTICMLCLYQDFMLLWMRGNTELMLPEYDMILFCVYFYAITMNNVRNQYVNGVGLFWKLRYTNIFEAFSNIVLNFVLGYFFGITGILTATLITIIFFNYIARTNILFREYFNISPMKFYLQNITYIVATGISGICTYFICSFINIGTLPDLMIKAAICIILPNAVFLLIYFKTDKFRQAREFAKNLMR